MSDSNSLSGLSIVIPVYKENSKVVTNLYTGLTLLGAEVTIVDDGDTVDLPDEVNELSYTPNKGYGYAIKQGIKVSTNSLILVLDGDGQHSVADAIKLYSAYKLITNCDMLIGSRQDLEESFLRWLGRKVLNSIGGLISGHHLADLNSGMRIFKRDLAIKYEPILCDTFSFTTSFTLSMMSDNYKVFWFPIEVQPRAYGTSHVKVVKHGLITLYYIIVVGLAVRTRKIRSWLRKYLPLLSRWIRRATGAVANKTLEVLNKGHQ